MTLITVPGVTPGQRYPRIGPSDPFDINGTMLLLDAGRGSLDAGAPAANAKVWNLAPDKSAKMLGAGTRDTLSCTVSRTGMTGNKGLVERSSKGGLHAIFSRTNNSTPADGTHAAIVMPTTLATMWDTWATDKWFVSQWVRITRASDADVSARTATLLFGQSTTAFDFIFSTRGSTYPNSGTHPSNYLGGRTTTTPLDVGAHCINRGLNGRVGSATLASAADRRLPFVVGNYGGGINTFEGGTQPPPMGHHASAIWYRTVVHNLTVSGMTYAQADALDAAMFAQDVTATTGRFYETTAGTHWTNPSTLP